MLSHQLVENNYNKIIVINFWLNNRETILHAKFTFRIHSTDAQHSFLTSIWKVIIAWAHVVETSFVTEFQHNASKWCWGIIQKNIHFGILGFHRLSSTCLTPQTGIVTFQMKHTTKLEIGFVTITRNIKPSPLRATSS